MELWNRTVDLQKIYTHLFAFRDGLSKLSRTLIAVTAHSITKADCLTLLRRFIGAIQEQCGVASSATTACGTVSPNTKQFREVL